MRLKLTISLIALAIGLSGCQTTSNTLTVPAPPAVEYGPDIQPYIPGLDD